MYALPEIQSRFYDAMMAAAELDETAALELIEEDVRRGRRRLAAYRRGIFGNLCNALVTSYPVVVSIVGLPFLREAARLYILSNPSHSGDLNDYGEGFAAFIGDYPHARELPYLADVARLDWLAQATRNAADREPTDMSLLASIPAERYGDLVFDLDPAHARLDSDWPLPDIWRVNQPSYRGDMTVDFSRGSRVLLRRERSVVKVEALGIGAAAFLDALAGRIPLARAAAEALRQEPGFEFGAKLRDWIAAGLICKAQLETGTGLRA